MIKPEDIIQVEFSRSLFGYDMKEVDTLLDAVIEQMEAWERERQEMLTALECLLQELEQQAPQDAETVKEQIPVRDRIDRIAHGQSAEHWTESSPVFAARKRKRGAESDSQPKMQPLPQAVPLEEVEPMQDIPLAKIPTQSEETEFEIPTYLFAGEAEPMIRMPAVAEEVEVETAIPVEQEASVSTASPLEHSEATPSEQIEQEA